MAKVEKWFAQDLKKSVPVRYLDGSFFNEDAAGNRIGVEVYSDGNAVTLAGSITGYCVRPDGTTVPISGVRSSNRAYIDIPQSALAVPGPLTVTIKNTESSVITTLCAVVGIVTQSRTGVQVDPGQTITDWTNQISAQLQAVQTAADNLGSTLAVPYDSLTFPVTAGTYTVYNGNVYRANQDISTSEEWTPSHWTQVKVCNEIYDLKTETTELAEHFPATGKLVAGISTTASANGAVATGVSTTASGRASHAEGQLTTADGQVAHAEGYGTFASGDYSHAEGFGTIANGDYQHAVGKYNVEDTNDTYLEIAGNGTGDDARSNARTLDWNGNETLAGDLTVNKGGAGEMVLGQEVSSLKSALNVITYNSPNKLPIASLVTVSSDVTRNYADGVLKSTGTADSGGGRLSAFTPQFILEAGTYTLSKNVVSGIARPLFVIFANDDNYITLPSANNSITFTIETDKVASISFAYSTGADYTNEYQIQIEVGEVATQFQKPSYKSAVDLVARADISAEREKLTHIKVMSYNVGSYNMGVSQDFTPEQQAEITKVYRKFFNDQNCDILGLQEAKTNFSSGNPVNPQIYSPLYTNIVDSINTSAIKSRFHFVESGTFDISTDTADNRHCAYCICEIAGHEVYVLDTHFSPISAELRQDNYAEVLEILSQHEFFICFGDFNCVSDYTEYNAFTNAGYHIANCGYLGVLNTMGSQIGTNNPIPNDNIVTSGNIIISGVKVLDELYSTLKSDHLPIVADLIFNA